MFQTPGHGFIATMVCVLICWASLCSLFRLNTGLAVGTLIRIYITLLSCCRPRIDRIKLSLLASYWL